MKKRKIKLFASLTSLVMVVAVMAVGIWAANAQTISFTANVSLQAASTVAGTLTATTNATQPDSNKVFTVGEEATNVATATLGNGFNVETGVFNVSFVFNGDEVADIFYAFTFDEAEVMGTNRAKIAFAVTTEGWADNDEDAETTILSKNDANYTVKVETTPAAEGVDASVKLIFSVIDKAQEITATTFGFTLTVDRVAPEA